MKTIPMRKLTWVAIPLAALALAVAGCGGDDASGGDTTASTDPGSGAATVAVAAVDGLGDVLVDPAGRTLYDFRKDEGTTSSCYGACAESWPPLLVKGEPEAGDGADADLLGVTQRRDGGAQVTYDGHPLYTFTGDEAPGEANGNDVEAFGAEWYALTPSGGEPEEEGSAPPPPTSY